MQSATSGSFNVAGSAGCTWSASTSDSWITLKGATSGEGTGTVSFDLAQNTGIDRTGSIRVAVTGASESGVFRWSEGEAALTQNFAPDAVKGLKASADGLIGDLHGTPEYRAHLIPVLTARAVSHAG